MQEVPDFSVSCSWKQVGPEYPTQLLKTSLAVDIPPTSQYIHNEHTVCLSHIHCSMQLP
jgi:hypothetical protein